MKKTALLLMLCFVFTTVALADGPGEVEWSVVAAGGGSMTDGVYALGATAGQGAVGVAEDGVYTLQAGFWHTWPTGAPSRWSIYLPLILRNR